MISRRRDQTGIIQIYTKVLGAISVHYLKSEIKRHLLTLTELRCVPNI